MGNENEFGMGTRQDGKDVEDSDGTFGVGGGLEGFIEKNERMGAQAIHNVRDALDLPFETAGGITDLKFAFGGGELRKDAVTDTDLSAFGADGETGLCE